MNQKTGKVWLVGAGPGDIGLFTLKGKEILEQADTVVYDNLIGDAVLALIPDAAEKLDVGKRAGNHPVKQEEINRILLDKAKEGKRVVRLKGGDPFLFGRGGEELELLAEHGISFEIVPGVTSAFAVPAYAGIPVTHRDFCSSVHIITGHRRTDKGNRDNAAISDKSEDCRRKDEDAVFNETEEIDYEALVRAGGTLIFLMGVTALPDICQNLILAGMAADTPAAVVQEGTTAGQRILIATAGTLPQRAAEEKIKAPAVIIIGDVCRLQEKFAWHDALPLSGCRILLTRPRERMAGLSGKLRTLGAEVLEIPAIRIRPLCGDRIEKELSRLQEYDWIVFTSPGGVNIFFDVCLRREKTDIRTLMHMRFAVLGPGTGRTLAGRGIYPDLMPETYDAASLGKILAEECEKGANILVPRAAAGSPLLINEIKRREDLAVTDLPIYETLPGEPRVIDLKSELQEERIDLVVFTSASGVRGFVQMVSRPDAEDGEDFDFSKIRAVCIGKQTQAAAERFGMKACAAREATEDAIAEKITEIF